MLYVTLFLQIGVSMVACAAVGSSSENTEMRYGCSIDPWNSILSRIPAVQDLQRKNGTDGPFKRLPQPSCRLYFDSESAILGYLPLILNSFHVALPGLDRLWTVTNWTDDTGTVLTRETNNIKQLLVSLFEISPMLIVYKPGGEGFPVEFRARGLRYTLRGTVQGDGRNTWAHVNTGNLKFGSTYSKVYPSGKEKDANPNEPINKETQILVYAVESFSDIADELTQVKTLKASLSEKVEKSILPQIYPQIAGFTGLDAEAAKKMVKLYDKCKRDYFDSKSTFHPDWQMVRLNSLSSCMTRAFNDMGMWVEPAQYRETHPDVPTLFINHDENCFLTTALTAIFHGLPPALVDSFIDSSTDAGLRVALQVLMRKVRNGSAAEDLHDVRVAMGERFKWCDSSAPYSVIKRLKEMMPAFDEQSVLWRWMTDLSDSSVQDNIDQACRRDLVSKRVDSGSIEPVRVVFIGVQGVASGVEPNMKFLSNSLIYDLAASVDYNRANSHFTVNVRVASQETPGTYKWFKIDNHVPWQISPPEPFPWPEYSGGALVKVPPILSDETQFLMYVLREKDHSQQARASVNSLAAADVSAEE